MRVAGFGLLGFVAGAIAGVVLTILGLALWYDVLGIGDPGGDQLNGLAQFLVFAPLLALAGGLGGAIWLARRAQAGKGVPIVVLILLLLVVAYLFLSPMFFM